jgi:uncharacterized membrane protein
MNLPSLTIPSFPLPFEIPAMMHPAIVHFAVALPVVILLLEIINLMARRKAIGSVSFLLLVLMAAVYFGAYLTGVTDADAAKNALSPEAKSLLEAHKNGGIWLVYSTAAVLLIKLISVGVNKLPARIVFLVAMALFFWGATGVVQKGCALTYKHGVNVHKDAVAAPAPKAEAPKAEAAAHTEAVETQAAEAAHAVEAKAEETAHKVEEAAHEATETVKEHATETSHKAEEAAHEATEAVKEKATQAAEKAEEVLQPAAEPAVPAN